MSEDELLWQICLFSGRKQEAKLQRPSCWHRSRGQKNTVIILKISVFHFKFCFRATPAGGTVKVFILKIGPGSPREKSQAQSELIEVPNFCGPCHWFSVVSFTSWCSDMKLWDCGEKYMKCCLFSFRITFELCLGPWRVKQFDNLFFSSFHRKCSCLFWD